MGAPKWSNPFRFSAFQFMTGIGAGCGVGIGFGRPLNLGGIPGIGEIVGSMQGMANSSGASSVVQHARVGLRKLGLPNLDAGVGCGVGIGYGWGIGLALKPGVAEELMEGLQVAFEKAQARLTSEVARLNNSEGSSGDSGAAAVSTDAGSRSSHPSAPAQQTGGAMSAVAAGRPAVPVAVQAGSDAGAPSTSASVLSGQEPRQTERFGRLKEAVLGHGSGSGGLGGGNNSRGRDGSQGTSSSNDDTLERELCIALLRQQRTIEELQEQVEALSSQVGSGGAARRDAKGVVGGGFSRESRMGWRRGGPIEDHATTTASKDCFKCRQRARRRGRWVAGQAHQ